MLDYQRQEAAVLPAKDAVRCGLAWEVDQLTAGVRSRLEFRSGANDAVARALGPCDALRPYPRTPAGRACPLARLFAVGIRRRS